jgi:hypothetical protein
MGIGLKFSGHWSAVGGRLLLLGDAVFGLWFLVVGFWWGTGNLSARSPLTIKRRTQNQKPKTKNQNSPN